VPVGALGRAESNKLSLLACIADPSGEAVIRVRLESDVSSAETLGEKTAEELLRRGGQSILRRTL